MSYPGFRTGYHVRLNGRDFKAAYTPGRDTAHIVVSAEENPDPSRFEWRPYYKGWVTEVPIGECERVFSVNTFCTYQGYRCEVVRFLDDGTAEIQYADWNGSWAGGPGGFVQHNKYEFLKTVPASELHDYHEEQLDQLFEDWRERTFPRERP